MNATDTTRVVSLLIIGAAACTSSSQPSQVPPAISTHHVMLEGTVVSRTGASIGTAEIGPRTAVNAEAGRSAVVEGGAIVSQSGSYSFEAKTTTPSRSDGIIEFYVLVGQVQANGGRVLRDSTLVRTRVVPLAMSPPVYVVPSLRVP